MNSFTIQVHVLVVSIERVLYTYMSHYVDTHTTSNRLYTNIRRKDYIWRSSLKGKVRLTVYEENKVKSRSIVSVVYMRGLRRDTLRFVTQRHLFLKGFYFPLHWFYPPRLYSISQIENSYCLPSTKTTHSKFHLNGHKCTLNLYIFLFFFSTFFIISFF